jgi:hypothetical protein
MEGMISLTFGVVNARENGMVKPERILVLVVRKKASLN